MWHVSHHSAAFRRVCISLLDQRSNSFVRSFQTRCPATVTRISKHLNLYKPVTETARRGRPQTLAIVFPYLWCPDSVVRRHCNLYLYRGVNVLSVRGSLKHFLWPPASKMISEELLSYLATNETPLSTHQFIVHTTSLGSYIYTVMLMEIFENEARYGFIKSKIKGQVFDSFINGSEWKMVNNITIADSSAVITYAVKNLLGMYLLFTRSYAQHFYDKAARFIETAPIHSQVLFYHSLNDHLSDSAAFHDMVSAWSSKEGMDLHVKCWHQSKHAQHLLEHPREYMKALQGYLESVGVH